MDPEFAKRTSRRSNLARDEAPVRRYKLATVPSERYHHGVDKTRASGSAPDGSMGRARRRTLVRCAIPVELGRDGPECKWRFTSTQECMTRPQPASAQSRAASPLSLRRRETAGTSTTSPARLIDSRVSRSSARNDKTVASSGKPRPFDTMILFHRPTAPFRRPMDEGAIGMQTGSITTSSPS